MRRDAEGFSFVRLGRNFFPFFRFADRFYGQPKEYSADIKKNEEGIRMGDVVVILALALYVPMSMVYMLAGKG